MKTRNKHLAISTLALAMVLIIACGEETGVNNGSTVPNDTSAVAGSSSAKETSSSGEDGGGGTGTSANSSSVSGMSSNSHTGTSSGSLEGSSANQSSSSVVRYSSGCVDGETEVIFGVTFLCMDGELVAQLAPRSSSSPYYDSDDVFLGGVNQKFTPSEFLDDRDGQTYKTVVLKVSTVGAYSEYREYFAQNLNYGTQVFLKEGQVQTPGTKYCYNDDPLHCKHNLGGLYTWSNAMGLPAACDTVAVGSAGCPKEGMLSRGAIRQGLCPAGWHVMNQSDFTKALLATESVSTVQSQAWPKSIPAGNMSGFSALPGGKGVTLGQLINGSNFVHLDSIAFFWFTEEANRAMGRSLRITNNSYEHLNDTSNKTTPLSVRCVRELDD